MKIPKVIIWTKFFFKSFIWLILPLCILGNIKSCSSYNEAGKHLTPYSVSVSGYYRSDGVYVSSYNRRPPGSVKHDEPYESKRTYMSVLFIVCLIGGGGSILAYASMSFSEIERQRKIIEDIENKKREEDRQFLINDTLKIIDYDFSELSVVPKYLKKGKSLKCKFCKRGISMNDFYVSFIAVSNKHYVCMNCVSNRVSIGRNESRSKYINEIKYCDSYNKMLSEFKIKFINANKSEEFIFRDYDLEKIFDSELNKAASTYFQSVFLNNTKHTNP